MSIQLIGVHSRKYAHFANAFLVASGVSFVYGYSNWNNGKIAQANVDYKKSQIVKPIYELQGDELVNPPWNEKNKEEWLYRPVRITGRALHYLGMYVPRTEYGKDGFEYVVPFVTSETPEFTEQKGLLVSLGFVPHEYKDISNRRLIENSDVQTIDTVLTQLPELQDIQANVTLKRVYKIHEFNYADLEDMAKFTDFLNKDQIGPFVLEKCAFKTPLDERNMRLYDLDADHIQHYPYLKTRSGILNHKGEMTWDYRKRQNLGFSAAGMFGVLGLLSLV